MKYALMDSKEAALELRMTVATVRRLAISGIILGRKAGKRWFFKTSEIKKYLTGKDDTICSECGREK